MHPIIFDTGIFKIYSYGVMLAFGFGLASWLVYKRAPAHGLDRDSILNMLILSLVGGLAGARLLYIFLNYDYYISNPFEIVNLSKGGLVWYGAFFSGTALAIWYMAKRHLDFWVVADLVAPYIALAQALGRIGCFLNGCCYGQAVPRWYPLGVLFPDSHALRHPTQLYSSLALLLIFVILRLWQERPHFKGAIFLGYCMLYSLKRFDIEFLRGDNPRLLLNLTLSQFISLFIIAVSAFFLIRKWHEWKRDLSSK